jgi:tellurite resistance protein TehA-like permease
MKNGSIRSSITSDKRKGSILSFLFLVLFLLSFNLASALTPDGSSPAGDNMNIFITALFIFSTLGLFYTFFVGIAKLAMSEMNVYDVLISWSFYILVIIVNHLTAHYVEDTFMFDLTNTFLNITVWSNGVLPLISFVISIFVRSTKKKRPLSVAEMAGKRMVSYG